MAPPAKRACYGLRSQSSQSSLMILNDDCSLKISEFMSPLDLCEVACTCKRLLELAQYHFRLKYAHFDFFSLLDHGILTAEMVKKVLRIFGHQITSISLLRSLFADKRKTSDDIMLAIKRYCGNLKELTLDGFIIHGTLLSVQLKPLFERVEILDISDGYIKWPRNALVKLL